MFFAALTTLVPFLTPFLATLAHPPEPQRET
jgi:hypothetical protein